MKFCWLLNVLAQFFCAIQFSWTYWPPPYKYATHWFVGMPVDHFSFDSDNSTFLMRYLINDTYFAGKDGAIFFYCGNEGDITLFANNTGFVWDLAPSFRAMVVFAEHRYYGETMPFGNKSYEKSNLGKLSSGQALADFAVFLDWLKSNDSKWEIHKNTPVIAFGGSYGGMLAAWMRIKYPHIITGALASSAPIVQFTGFTGCEIYSSIVNRVYNNSGFGCTTCIKRSWPLIREYAKTDENRAKLNKLFHFCPKSLVTNPENASQIVDWLTDIWGSLAMINYPYATNFLNPVPAWPVKVSCERVRDCDEKTDPDSVLEAIHQAISVFMNYTGSTKCFSFSEDSTPSLGTSGWNYQACTEMIMPMCNTDDTMFEKSDWNITQYSDMCFKNYNARPRVNWAVTEYGGPRLKYASNIIFSNGDLDPWSGGGVLYNVSETTISIIVKNGAHHYDLRGKHPNDTSYVKDVRRLEAYYIHKWIKDYKKLLKSGQYWYHEPLARNWRKAIKYYE